MGQRNKSTFTVTRQRRDEAHEARLILIVGCVTITALALVACAAVPVNAPTRAGVVWAVASFGILTGFVAPVLLWRACKRADRGVGPAGELLHLGSDAVIVSGAVRVPWSAVSEVSVHGGGGALRRYAHAPLLGVVARLLLRAAAPAGTVRIGISDPSAVRGVTGRARRRVVVPLGAWICSSEMTLAASSFRRRVPSGVPVRTRNMTATARRHG